MVSILGRFLFFCIKINVSFSLFYVFMTVGIFHRRFMLDFFF